MKKFILFISIFLCASNLMAQDLGNGFTRKVNFDVIVTDTSSFEHVVHFMRVDKTYCSGMHTLEAIFPLYADQPLSGG